MSRTIYVAKSGSDHGEGTSESPFLTINRAAQVALPGDTVEVREGVYREWVKPARGGLSDQRRITYRPAEGEKVTITGSERVDGWENTGGTTWKVEVPNTLFGDFNPFAEEVAGDWVVYPSREAPRKHLGDVYLNGESFYEASSIEEVENAVEVLETVDDWTGTTVPTSNPTQTKFRWFAEVGRESTLIWANFHGADPNEELVEINVRRSVFFPIKNHVDYVTVRGFELAQSATPWAPPTADQPGLIGPNWAKGWIIEDNVIHDAKCSAVSLGKEESTGHNFFTLRDDKPGYQYQLESVFSARQIGWDKEHIGSHIVRRNHIYNCGQNGVVGHLGCVFSTIKDNHIHDIALKREFYGYEIGGIKLHAAIDVVIEHNRINDCSLGLWLDWQTQGTRITRNLFYDNDRDIFVEVSHGPYVVDHNIFASPAAIETFSQGGAYVGNLVLGSVRLEPVMDRATPYHRPNSTEVAGYAVIYGADDRFIGNVFVPSTQEPYSDKSHGEPEFSFGTSVYDGHPASFEEYLQLIGEQPDSDHEKFPSVKQPVYIRNNAYLQGATHYDRETNPTVVTEAAASPRILEEGDNVFLEYQVPKVLADQRIAVTTTDDLEPTRFTDLNYTAPDGSDLVLNVDLTGKCADVQDLVPQGPLFGVSADEKRYKVW